MACMYLPIIMIIHYCNGFRVSLAAAPCRFSFLTSDSEQVSDPHSRLALLDGRSVGRLVKSSPEDFIDIISMMHGTQLQFTNGIIEAIHAATWEEPNAQPLPRVAFLLPGSTQYLILVAS